MLVWGGGEGWVATTRLRNRPMEIPFWQRWFVPEENRLASKNLADLGERFDETFLSPAVRQMAREARIDTISQPGEEWRVKYQGSLWRARALGQRLHLAPGDVVYVVARRGNVLFIDVH